MAVSQEVLDALAAIDTETNRIAAGISEVANDITSLLDQLVTVPAADQAAIAEQIRGKVAVLGDQATSLEAVGRLNEG